MFGLSSDTLSSVVSEHGAGTVGSVWTELTRTGFQGMNLWNKNAGIAIEGDVAATGARSRQLIAAYNEESLAWSETSLFTVPDPSPPEGGFAASVAIDGEWMLIGAFYEEPFPPFIAGPGAAYLYKNIGGTWTPKTRLLASDAEEYPAYVGWAVDIENGIAVVGSPQNDGVDAGAVYLFDVGAPVDCNANAVPDECTVAPTVDLGGCRYLTVTPTPAPQPVALLVTSPDFSCVLRYADSNGTLAETPTYQSTADWGVVQVHGVEIVPEHTYAVQTEFSSTVHSPVVSAVTAVWGDAVGEFTGGA
jgi:hypothetical protein